MTFDTFIYAEGLKNSGMAEEHVRALTQELTRAFKSEDLATKQDIEATRQDIEALALATKQDIKIETEKLRKEIEVSKSETIKWVIGLMVAQTGIVIAAIKLL